MNAETRKMLHDALVKKLVSQGKLVEAGWASHRANIVPQNLPLSGAMVEELRIAFMAGAQHLFGAVVAMLDPGEEPTGADLIRMDMLATELAGVAEVLMAKARANGRA